MKMNGITVTTHISEELLAGIAEGVAAEVYDPFTIKAISRVGSTYPELSCKLQNDTDFRSMIQAYVVKYLEESLEDGRSEAIENLYEELVYNQPNHWIADHRARLQDADNAIEFEDSLLSDIEHEIEYLKSQGYTVEQVDPSLKQVIDNVAAAGYIVKAPGTDQ